VISIIAKCNKERGKREENGGKKKNMKKIKKINKLKNLPLKKIFSEKCIC